VTTTPCPDNATLAAYIDGRLPASEIPRLSSHLVDCERCYESVAAAVRFLHGVRRVEDIDPPLALLPALATAVVMAIGLTASLLLLGQVP